MVTLYVKATSLAWLLTSDLRFARICIQQYDEAIFVAAVVLSTGLWHSHDTFAASPSRNRKGVEHAAELPMSSKALFFTFHHHSKLSSIHADPPTSSCRHLLSHDDTEAWNGLCRSNGHLNIHPVPVVLSWKLLPLLLVKFLWMSPHSFQQHSNRSHKRIFAAKMNGMWLVEDGEDPSRRFPDSTMDSN